MARERIFGNNQVRHESATESLMAASSSTTSTTSATSSTSTTPFCPPIQCPPMSQDPGVAMVSDPIKEGLTKFLTYLGGYYGSMTVLAGVFHVLVYASLCK